MYPALVSSVHLQISCFSPILNKINFCFLIENIKCRVMLLIVVTSMRLTFDNWNASTTYSCVNNHLTL